MFAFMMLLAQEAIPNYGTIGVGIGMGLAILGAGLGIGSAVWLVPRLETAMRVPVAVYIVVISIMVWGGCVTAWDGVLPCTAAVNGSSRPCQAAWRPCSNKTGSRGLKDTDGSTAPAAQS